MVQAVPGFILWPLSFCPYGSRADPRSLVRTFAGMKKTTLQRARFEMRTDDAFREALKKVRDSYPSTLSSDSEAVSWCVHRVAELLPELPAVIYKKRTDKTFPGRAASRKSGVRTKKPSGRRFYSN